MVKSYPLAVFLSSHPLNITVSKRLLLLLLQNKVHLSSMFDAELQYLQRILNKIMLDVHVHLSVSSETRHMVYLKHPWFQFMI